MDELDPEPERRVETIEFAPVRVGRPGRRGRGRPGLVAAAWFIVVATFVAFAALGRPGADPLAVRSPAAVAVASPAPNTGPPFVGVHLRPDTPATFAITVTPTSGGLGITGTVLDRSVVRVSIRVVDVAGAAVATRSMSVEDLDGAIRPAYQRGFSVLFGLSANDLLTASFVEVDGYDSVGATVGSALHSLATLLGPCGAGRPCGAS